jgi:hypothetical protein
MNFKTTFQVQPNKRHEIFAETRVNEEGPSLAVIRPLNHALLLLIIDLKQSRLPPMLTHLVSDQ